MHGDILTSKNGEEREEKLEYVVPTTVCAEHFNNDNI